MWHYTYSWLYWWSKVPGVPNNNLLMLEVHSKIGECFCPAVCSTERHCCPEPWRLKRLNALLLLLLTGRRGWKCGGAAPVVFFCLDLLLFWWVFCSRMSVSKTNSAVRQSGVSLGGFLCSLFCDRAAGLLSVELSIVMFSGSCMFSQTLMLKHSQVVTSGQRQRGRRGELSCGDP